MVRQFQNAFGAQRMLFNLYFVIAANCLIFVGCKPAAKPISGKVTLNGQPLTEALIMFIPLEPGHKKTGAPIELGNYSIEPRNGLHPGKYRVEIIDNPPMSLAHRPPEELAAILKSRRVIPLKYSQQSPLQIEVTGDSDQDLRQLDFQLASSPPH